MANSSSETDTEETATNNQTRKKKTQKQNWKRIKQQKERYQPTFKPEKLQCSHSKGVYKCKELKLRDLRAFHNRFYGKAEKAAQDNFILKHCHVDNPSRQRAKDGSRTWKLKSIKYFVTGKKVKESRVCRDAFLQTLGLKKHRLEHVMAHYLKHGTALTEKRGGDRKSVQFAAKKDAVINFISLIPTEDEHYCREHSPYRSYVSSELSIAKLCRMYNEGATPDLQVKEDYFRMIFNTNFNIGFGSPRSDVCSTCLRLKEEIKVAKAAHTRNKLEAELLNHEDEADIFFKNLQEKKEGLLIVSFDCQKNLPLPKLPDQSTYFSRQLHLYHFCVVIGCSKDRLNKDNTSSYVWLEHQHRRGSNQIASALFHRLCKIDYTGINTLRLVSDGCAAQNKNSIVLGTVAHWLLKHGPKIIKRVELIFPVTGHSFMSADRVFGNIEKQFRKKEVIIQPNEYLEAMSKCTVLEVEKDWKVRDWKTELKTAMKPTTQFHFHISECKRVIIAVKRGKITVRGEEDYTENLCDERSIFYSVNSLKTLKPPVMSPWNSDLSREKVNDVEKLLTKHYGDRWKTNQDLKFYKKLIELFDNNQT